MNRVTAVLALALVCSSASAQENKPARPRINGIGRVTIYVHDRDSARDFYSHQLNYLSGPEIPCDPPPHFCYASFVQVLDIVSPSSPDEGKLLGEVDFRTPDIQGMHRYLENQKVKVSEIITIKMTVMHYEMDYFSAIDPDGHPIGFVHFDGCIVCETTDAGVAWPILHAGFVVRDRAAEERFYEDVLGFRPYWHGGMKDGQDDWVSLQVPNGTDWVEFMVNISPSADHRTLGVMNHIALGVRDIHKTQEFLVSNGWKQGEQPHIGRGGKWQLNVYDPDGTRIEFMEFKPVQKPCCSEYTGPHPGPQQ
jgi:catechol 2,3-dioxygenase-like lactoylglutathione lyase family enzyme